MTCLLFFLMTMCRFVFMPPGDPYVRPMNKITAVAGENMKIKCPVAGYPINEIRWEKGAFESGDHNMCDIYETLNESKQILTDDKTNTFLWSIINTYFSDV